MLSDNVLHIISAEREKEYFCAKVLVLAGLAKHMTSEYPWQLQTLKGNGRELWSLSLIYMNMCNTIVLYVFNNFPFKGLLFVSWRRT